MSYSTRSQVITMWKLNYSLKKIKARLEEEGIVVSKTSICLLIKKYKATGLVADHRPHQQPRKLQDIHYRFIDERMSENDELTAVKLHAMLREQFPDVSVSESTVKRAKRELGWVAKKTRYCALISEVNQEKRVQWCQKQIDDGDLDFENVVWTDGVLYSWSRTEGFVSTR